jgi:hypothetical protein
MIIFENEGEIDPRLITLIGVNVKQSASAIGFFGTGLKYAVACMARWGEEIRIQSGAAEFTFTVEETEIRGRDFSVLTMRGKRDSKELSYTTELGKTWEPWMVYRELWCNAHDEPSARVYEDAAPSPKAGMTRVIVSGPKIEAAHKSRDEFILDTAARKLLHSVEGLDIYEGEGHRIFYRGIAVQKPGKPSLYTYNITEHLYLTEDRQAGSWSTDPIIARGLTLIEGRAAIDATLLAPAEKFESRLDYHAVHQPGEQWLERAEIACATRPFDVPSSVRGKFVQQEVSHCPTCGREM